MPDPNETQTLENGQIFLHYRIDSRLGVGGMGEVYLVSDTKLGRKVALKILPIDRMMGQESVGRFEQEARAASALNHPGIAHIYEIGESDGLHFIAMEYVEGASLEEKIGGHPLSIAETVQVGREIADALDEAHAQGIVHRDIKPANIMIDRRDRVKILDFGLAKMSPSISSEDSTAVKTRSGVVMGTVSYMSPEQALGRETDARSDLWSLGVILYEMTTGRIPFQGQSITETIDKITHAQPDAIARFNYEVPPELEVIIKKALRKDPSERYQSARDLLTDLRSLSKELDLTEHSTAPGFRAATDRHVEQETRTGEQATQTLIRGRTTEEARAATIHSTSSAEYLVGEIKRHKTGIAVAAVILIAVIAGGLGLYKYFLVNRTPAPPRELKFVRLTNGGMIENETIGGGAHISPDGKRVVFWTDVGGKASCWIRQVSTNSTVKIFGPVDSATGGSTFSPDGEFVYFSLYEKNQPVLYQLPVLGGTPRRVLDGVASPVTFSPDGKQIAFVSEVPGETSLKVVNTDGSGTPRVLVRRQRPELLSTEGPGWSPDGKVIAVGSVSLVGNSLDGGVLIVPAEGGSERVIASSKWGYIGRVAWLPDGSGLVTDQFADPLSPGTQLWFVSYPDGSKHRITNDLNGYGTVSLGLTADASTIVTVQEDFSQPIFVMDPNEDPSRAKQITNGKYDGQTGLATTQDGKVVYCAPSGEADDIWIMNSDGTAKRQLTNDQYLKAGAKVSPDGRYIVFISNRSGGINIWRIDIDGNNLRQLTEGSVLDGNPTFSPDSDWVIFNSSRTTGKTTLWRVSVDGGTPVQLTDEFTSHPAVSPDGKFIACLYADNKGQSQDRLVVLPFDGGDLLKSFDLPDSMQRDAGIAWGPDGQAIAYTMDQNPSNIISQPIAGGPSKPLTSFKSDRIYSFAWTRNGKQLVYSRGPWVDDVLLIKDFR